jgi:hypothetical protein
MARKNAQAALKTGTCKCGAEVMWRKKRNRMPYDFKAERCDQF